MNLNREILRLAVPSIVSNITVPLLGLADVTIMGHIGDARYLAAIAVGSMMFNVMYWLFGFLRMMTSGLTAQAYGAGDHPERILWQSMRMALGVGILIVLLQWPLREMGLWLMGPSDEVAGLVVPYYNICVWGAPAVLGLYALTGWFVGMQNTRIPMVIAISQNVVNIAASVLFVFGLGMQVEGVALGTLVAQWTGFAMALRSLPRPLQESGASGAMKSCKEGGGSFPLFLRTLCLVAVNFFFTSAGARQGAVVLAVNTLLMQLFTIFSYFMDGFAYAGEALTGRYYGARDLPMLKRVVRNLFGWGVAMVVLFTLLYWIGGEAFLSLLTSDAAVIAASAPYLPWAVLIPLCGVAAFVWDGVFVGITETRGMFVSCFIAALAFFAIWLCGSSAWGNHALWLALLVYLALRGVVQTVIFRHFPWPFQK